MQKAVKDQQTAQGDDPGLSSLEWAEVWKCGERMATRRLRKLWLAGRLVNGYRRTTGMDGRAAKTPVYRAK